MYWALSKNANRVIPCLADTLGLYTRADSNFIGAGCPLIGNSVPSLAPDSSASSIWIINSAYITVDTVYRRFVIHFIDTSWDFSNAQSATRTISPLSSTRVDKDILCYTSTKKLTTGSVATNNQVAVNSSVDGLIYCNFVSLDNQYPTASTSFWFYNAVVNVSQPLLSVVSTSLTYNQVLLITFSTSAIDCLYSFINITCDSYRQATPLSFVFVSGFTYQVNFTGCEFSTLFYLNLNSSFAPAYSFTPYSVLLTDSRIDLTYHPCLVVATNGSAIYSLATLNTQSLQLMCGGSPANFTLNSNGDLPLNQTNCYGVGYLGVTVYFNDATCFYTSCSSSSTTNTITVTTNVCSSCSLSDVSLYVTLPTFIGLGILGVLGILYLISFIPSSSSSQTKNYIELAQK